MKRIDINQQISAESIEAAAKVFAESLRAEGYHNIADMMEEEIDNGLYYSYWGSDNALVEKGQTFRPRENNGFDDYACYYGILSIGPGLYYAWFMLIEN